MRLPLKLVEQVCATMVAATLFTSMVGTAFASDSLTTESNVPTSAATASDAASGSAANDLPLRGSSRMGHEYAAINPPVAFNDPKTVNVTVFSLYACAPCAEANGVLQKWADSMPYFVKVENSPAVLNLHWSYLARVFFTLQAMGIEREERPFLFRAITQEGMNYADFKQLERWLDSRGVNLPQFEKTFDSNDVIAQTANVPNVMRMFQVVGVPTIVIDGKYIVTVASAGDLKRLPAVLSDVVTRAAQDKNLIH